MEGRAHAGGCLADMDPVREPMSGDGVCGLERIISHLADGPPFETPPGLRVHVRLRFGCIRVGRSERPVVVIKPQQGLELLSEDQMCPVD